MHSISKSLWLLFFLVISSCKSGDPADLSAVSSDQFQLFQVVSQETSNLLFENKLVENERINILNYLYYYNGSGVAAGDINNDGLPDLYFAATVGQNKLFLNQGNLRFKDITASAGVAGGFGITTGVNFVDINQDGFLDIYICKSGNHSDRYRTNQLFINNGKLGFTEMAAEYGLDDPSFSNQAYFFDMDRDDDLDMFLVNHPIDWPNINKIMTGTQEMEGFDYRFSDKLYRNNGQGKFEDITRSAGLLNRSWGLSASIGDFNGDQLPDIYVANDFIKPDNLYINNGDGTFSDQISEYFRHISFYAMGTDFADINNDGENDLYVADMAMNGHVRSKRNMGSMSTENFQKIISRGYHYPYSVNTLHLNLGKNGFTEIAQAAGVDKTDWSWSPLLVDLDNDGYKDLFVTNGIYRDIIDNDFLSKKSAYDEREEKNYFADLLEEIPQTSVKNVVFRNNRKLSFENVSEQWGIQAASCSTGAIYSDLDLDGDLDVVVNNLNEASLIYENQTAGHLSHNFLKIKLTGPTGNRNALGAKVELFYSGQRQRLDAVTARGYLSSVDPILQFGLGNVKAVDWVQVEWPNGKTSKISAPPINRLLEIDYAQTHTDLPEKTMPPEPLFEEISEEVGITYLHRETPYHDFEKELLLPHKLSQNGPFLAVADVDQNGHEDFFIGGSAGMEATLYLQQPKGGFLKSNQQAWIEDRAFEDQRSVFFDADQDGDVDLYVVSGSNEFTSPSFYQDRLYINDGKGNFQRSSSALPLITSSGMAVQAADFDQDGDLDLAVGGRLVPGRYPSSPQSYLLENRNGKFVDITEALAPDFQYAGMITDLQWSDYDLDGDLDLITVGEWMTITIFNNQEKHLKKVDAQALGLSSTSGWWFSLTEGDFDSDGDPDFLVGNLGLNNKYHPKPERPLHLYYHDFDANGSGDIVLSKAENNTLYPVRGRECSAQQMPYIAEKFPDFKSFATADMATIYSQEQLSEALHLQVEEFRSSLLINNGDGTFHLSFLPFMAQLSPITGAAVLDIHPDNEPDLIIAGNFFHPETETIRYDAGSGLCLKNDGQASFTPVDLKDSGFFTPGDVKDLQKIKLTGGETGILISNNEGRLQLFRKKLNGYAGS